MDFNGLAVIVVGFGNGHIIKIIGIVKILLPAVFVKVLAEIAQLIEQSEAGEVDTEVGGGFNMVSGQHAQTAGINRQCFGKPIFQGEVTDGGC